MWMLFVELLRYLVLAHFTTIQDLSSACPLIDWMHSWSLRSVRFCFCTRNFFSRPWESPTEWSPTICSTVPGTTMYHVFHLPILPTSSAHFSETKKSEGISSMLNRVGQDDVKMADQTTIALSFCFDWTNHALTQMALAVDSWWLLMTPVTTVTVLSFGPRICCLGEGLLAGDKVLSPVETAETCRFGRQIKKRCVE